MRNIFLVFTLTMSIFCLMFTEANAQWVQTNGPYGGNVLCLAATKVTNRTNIFAGTDGGVYLSTVDGY